ncbi:hypothetical protein CVT26_011199 [Gymnopilus dilepis]|uniref:Transcription factor TFIIB cyclin-like domain-containing protein n=1 Tax=Gymnopilus dilepis TaxID=231916 RepID=A0A409VJK3_9AGAR|nr:hypothetical protein CVT26_011199 [Gymnopilus dilepis]
MSCTHCGASTVWDDAVASAVCTACGSLADPSQSVLTSGYVHENDNPLWDPAPATTLKSLRAGHSWGLAGQGKETRDRKNAYAIADFIKSLALSLNATGLSPRAITLFNQVRAADNFQWGEKSKRVAAACLAIALRESNRPDSLRDIASLLSVPPASVIREFTRINSTLNLSLTIVDPSVYMATLQSHIASALTEPQQDTGLPDTLTKSLRTLSLLAVANTASSLSEVLMRLSPGHDVFRLPVPPTACAIFILAIEAENRALLNPLATMAQFLGSRCHLSKAVVMSRYKTIQDEIALWIEKVPWLSKYEGKKGKVSKRLVVARGIKDVIQFQEDLWEQKTRPTLELDLDEANDGESDTSSLLSRPMKRQRLDPSVSRAMQFLKDPLGTKINSAGNSRACTTSSHLNLATYLLANPPHHKPPSRLQLLVFERGGESHIPEDELFAEGELENLLRNPEEIEILRQTFGWTENDEEEEKPSGAKRKAKKKASNASTPETEDGILNGSALSPSKKSRLNMEALAQFMAQDDDEEGDAGDFAATVMGLEDAFNDFDGDYDVTADDIGPSVNMMKESSTPRRLHRPSNVHFYGTHNEEEVVLENWRPSTPEHITTTSTESRYEEEYD